MSVKRRADTLELVKGGTMNHRSHAGNRLLLPFVFLLFTGAGKGTIRLSSVNGIVQLIGF
jgi:hypothetical protein